MLNGKFRLITLLIVPLVGASCVSKGKYNAQVRRADRFEAQARKAGTSGKTCLDKLRASMKRARKAEADAQAAAMQVATQDKSARSKALKSVQA